MNNAGITTHGVHQIKHAAMQAASKPTVSTRPQKARNGLIRLSRLISRAGSPRWRRASGRNSVPVDVVESLNSSSPSASRCCSCVDMGDVQTIIQNPATACPFAGWCLLFCQTGSIFDKIRSLYKSYNGKSNPFPQEELPAIFFSALAIRFHKFEFCKERLLKVGSLF
jgi:hypothetical protein